MLMDAEALKDSLIHSLQRMYDMEVIAPFMEFCQGEMRVLLYLSANRDREIYPSDISGALYVSRQRITSVLAALRTKGYIAMETEEQDRRKMRVRLTEQGAGYAAGKVRFVERYFLILVDGLGERNVLELIRLINLSADHMEAHGKLER